MLPESAAPVLLYGPPPLLSGPSCSRRDIYCDVAFEWLNVSLADAEALAVAAEHIILLVVHHTTNLITTRLIVFSWERSD